MRNQLSSCAGKALLLAFALTLAVPLTAKAADPAEDGAIVSFGPRATYFKAKDADDGEWSGGAQLRVRPFRLIGFEGSVDYRRESFGDTRVHIYPVQASVLAYILPLDPVDIFLLGGAGWYYTTIDRPSGAEDDTDHRFGTHAGAGMEVHLNEAWSIDGTYRYVWLEEVKSRDDNNLFDKEFEDEGSQVTLALNYKF